MLATATRPAVALSLADLVGALLATAVPPGTFAATSGLAILYVRILDDRLTADALFLSLTARPEETSCDEPATDAPERDWPDRDW